MKFKIALLAVTAVATSFGYAQIAQAQPVTGPYVSLGAGTSIVPPYNNNLSGGTVTRGQLTVSPGGKVLTRPAASVVGAVGYGFGGSDQWWSGFRAELSGDWIRNTLTKFDSNNGIQIHVSGIQNTYGFMANGYYDFNVGLPIYPYLGAGIGYQEVEYQHNTFNNTTIGQSNGSFAYQVIAGLAYPIAPVPGLSLTAEYRFMQTTSNRSSSRTFVNGVIVANKGGQISYNSVLLGLRYQLFQPPPPPPAPAPAPVAAPAPAPAKTYLVFFDWDKYNLTPRATQIIAQAASDSHTQQTTTIAVSGYTDTSGTPTYNQGLSVRRAKAVAAQLVADGVPASEITAQGFGDTDLLVPTGPGVREPQNRRVQIVLQ